MYTISKTFRFEAAHSLVEPYKGRCATVHGHSYRVELRLRSEVLDNCGMVYDFGRMGPFAEYLKQKCDHSNLNDIIPQSTCENIARHLFDVAQGMMINVAAVRVYETANCWGEYTR